MKKTMNLIKTVFISFWKYENKITKMKVKENDNFIHNYDVKHLLLTRTFNYYTLNYASEGVKDDPTCSTRLLLLNKVVR